MFSVIALHSFCASMEWRLANLFYESAVIGVPLFFMVSGYLLIGKHTVDKKYVYKKIFNITKLIIILSMIWWIVTAVISGHLIIVDFFKIFLGAFVQKGSLWICWYLASMIIIYCLLPILNRLYVYRSYWYVLFLLFAIEVIVFYLNIGGKYGEYNIIQTFRIWNWLFYFLLAGGIKKSQIIINQSLLKLFIILLLILNIFFQEVLKPIIDTPFCEYFYSSFPVILLSTSLFLFIINCKVTNPSICRFVNFMSPLFLPVYLFHPIFLDLLSNLPLSESVKPYICFLLTSLLSICCCSCLNKVRWINRILKI